MSARTTFQSIAHHLVDFFEFTADLLGDDLTRRAIISDLGGDPGKANGGNSIPTDALEAIRSYRDAADPDLEATVQVVKDAASILDVIIGNIEVWADAFKLDDGEEVAAEILEDLGMGLLELAGSAWLRQRFFRWSLGLEAIGTAFDTASTYGPADAKYGRVVGGITGLLGFLLQPGKTFDSLDLGHDWKETSIDGLLRLGAAAFGVWDVLEKDEGEGLDFISDTYTGWDSPALSIDSGEEPTDADLISSHMISFSFVRPPKDPEADLTDTERLLITLMYVPEAEGGRGVFLALGGSLTIDEKLSEKWTLSGRLHSDAGIAAILGGGINDVAAGVTEASQVVALSSTPDPTTALSFSLTGPCGIRLDIGQVVLRYDLAVPDVSSRLMLNNAVFVLDKKQMDGFIKHLLPADPVRLPFNVAFGYSSQHGLILEGSVLPSPGTPGPGVQNSPLPGGGGFDAPFIKATIPLGKRISVLTLHEIAFTLARGSEDNPSGDSVYAVAADVSFSAQLGPVYFRLDQVGVGSILDFSDAVADKNLRFVDARFAINPPLGIAVQVDTGPVSGGGVLFHDPARDLYYGALGLRFRGLGTLKAIGLISSRNPDGSEGSSFIIIATLEDLGWRVGPLVIDGFGLLVAIDRTFDEDAVRTALPTGQLRNVLFPADPVHHTTDVLRSLETFFPFRADSYLFGILVRLAFGSDRLVRLDLALILQWGASVSNRLIVLGRVSSLLPDEAAPLIRLNLDAVGIFDPSEGVAALDAVLVDSKLCGRFALTGSAAFRRTPGQGGFALAVGGFHPAFRPPDGFPALRRITIALTSGDNPRLVCDAYLAITANTIQIGASATLYASACGFSIDGNIGFDVLIEPLFFHYLAEFRASVQLKRGSRNLFKVSVSGALEGTIPLRVAGRASFEILWCDFSVGFDKTLVPGSVARALPLVDVLGVLVEALADPRHWSSLEPPGALRLVTTRPDRPGAERVLLHPLGGLQVTQGSVPLNVARDLDRVGAGSPQGDRRLAITRVTLGTHQQDAAPVREFFAPADFFDLSDEEKLAAPSFEEMESGVAVADDAYRLDLGKAASSPFDYTDIVIDEDGLPHEEEEPHVAGGAFVFRMLLAGAAALAPSRTSSSERFGAQARPDAPRVLRRTWSVAADDGGVRATRSTWVEARAFLAEDSESGVVVAGAEVGS